MNIKVSKSVLSAVFLGFILLILSIFTSFGITNEEPLLTIVVWTIAICIAVFVAASGVLKGKNEMIVFFLAFAVRMAFSFFRYGGMDPLSPELGKDAAGFWNTAIEYSNGVFSNNNYTLFPYVLNFEFKLFGTNLVCCILSNVYLATMMNLVIVSLLNRLNITGTAREFAIIIGCCMPYSFNITANLWRESIYFLFIAASFLFYYDYIISKKVVYILLAMTVLLPVLLLHIGFFPIAFVYALDALFSDRSGKNSLKLSKVFILILMIAFVAIALNMESVSYLDRGGQGIQGMIDKLTGGNVDDTIASAGSVYLSNVTITSIPTLILYTPLRFIYFIFSPLPFDWRGISDIAAFCLDASIHFLFFFEAFRGISYLKNTQNDFSDDERALFLRIIRVGLWCFIGVSVVFCLGTRTAGTAIRHRDELIALEAVVIGVSLYVKNKCGKIANIYKR